MVVRTGLVKHDRGSLWPNRVCSGQSVASGIVKKSSFNTHYYQNGCIGSHTMIHAERSSQLSMIWVPIHREIRARSFRKLGNFLIDRSHRQP